MGTKRKTKKKLKIPKIYITKDKDGSLRTESFKEWKRQNPSPEEKRNDTGEKDYNHKLKIISKDKKTKESSEHSRRGNTQTKKVRTSRSISSGNETGKRTTKSDVKVVESGGKYKNKLGGYTSKRHHVTSSQESKSRSKLKIKKKKK
jgi:hypothetical protein